jgi:nucleotide-binding universal stress UspA family protein
MSLTTPPARMRRVLVAVDDSPQAMAAAEVAVAWAAGWGADLKAVTVVPETWTLPPGMIDRVGEAAAEDLRRRAMGSAVAVLARVAAMAERRGVRVTTEALTGEPAAKILAAARTWGADVVVIGRSHRRTSVATAYVGSQAQHVLEFSDRPVVVVPQPAHQR